MNRTRIDYRWPGLLALALVFGFAACSDDTEVKKYDFGTVDDSAVDAGADMPAAEAGPDMDTDATPPPAKKLVILQTTDMHDHVMGFGPEADFTADKQNDDSTLGGFSRLAAQIATEKAAVGSGDGLLLLDSGDWSMGTLFRFLSTTKAPTLSLMQDLGYDATTLGNHEFEWTCDGLAGNISAAVAGGFKVPIVASNLKFDATKPGDDNLEKLVKSGAIKDKLIKTVAGVKVGIFGLLGDGAAALVPTKDPLQVIGEGDGNEADPKKRKLYPHVQAIVDGLRNTDKVDLVIALSHSGVALDSAGKPTGKGDDELLAKYVTGIDVIVSGHTHKTLTQTIKVLDDTKTWTTRIIQSGAYVEGLGKLVLSLDKDNKITSDTFTVIKLDDSIKADAAIQTKIDNYIKDIDTALTPAGLAYAAPVAETTFDLTMPEYQETTLGDLVTDAYLTIYNTLNPTAKADLAIEGPGVIRDDLLKGKTGKIWFADLYRTNPLGIGPDQKPGYPLVAVHINGKELKMAMELLNLAEGPMINDNDYYLQISKGTEVTYTKNGLPTFAVTGIKVNGAAVNLTDTTTCYKVVTNYYLASLLGHVAQLSGGALQITPKESDCTTAITDITQHFVDADPGTAGIQELKIWQALLKYVTAFPDTNSNTIPDIPSVYSTAQGRIIKK